MINQNLINWWLLIPTECAIFFKQHYIWFFAQLCRFHPHLHSINGTQHLSKPHRKARETRHISIFYHIHNFRGRIIYIKLRFHHQSHKSCSHRERARPDQTTAPKFGPGPFIKTNQLTPQTHHTHTPHHTQNALLFCNESFPFGFVYFCVCV